MTKPPPHSFLAATRTLGALALLVVGGVHFQQYYYGFYSAIPTIGPLFLVNAVAGTTLGLFLLSPVRPRGRTGILLDELAALVGLAVGAGAFMGLLVSEHTSLFGFREHGYRFAIVLALASEAVVMVTLALFLIGAVRQARLGGPPYRRARKSDRDRATAQNTLTPSPKR
jgi:hypothetical protein